MADFQEGPHEGIRNGAAGKPQEVPRDCHPVDAVNPYTGKPGQLYLRDRTIDITARKGMGAALELAHTVREAVQQPIAVFRGVTEFEEGDENWLVYVARPSRAYDHKTGSSVPAWKGEVFLVFVDEERFIRRWYWDRAEDPKRPRLPASHGAGRFRERLL